MTSHELAKKLIELPDFPVAFPASDDVNIRDIDFHSVASAEVEASSLILVSRSRHTYLASSKTIILWD